MSRISCGTLVEFWNSVIQSIIDEWTREAGITNSAKCHRNVFNGTYEIFTDNPEAMKGDQNCLVDKYTEILNGTFGEVFRVRFIRKRGRQYADN